MSSTVRARPVGDGCPDCVGSAGPAEFRTALAVSRSRLTVCQLDDTFLRHRGKPAIALRTHRCRLQNASASTTVTFLQKWRRVSPELSESFSRNSE